MRRAARVRSLVVMLAAVLLAGSPSSTGAQAPPDTGASANERPSFPVTVWNREIARYRGSFPDLPPAIRAELAAKRILALPRAAEYRVETNPAALGDERGMVLLVNGKFALALLEKDLESGQQLDAETARVAENLKDWLASRDDQYRLPSLLRGAGWGALATLVALLIMVLLIRLSRRLRRRIEAASHTSQSPLLLGKANLRPYVNTVVSGVVRTLGWATAASVLYVWLTFVLGLFPYTRPWGVQCGQFLVDVFRNLGLGVLRSIPNLFVVAVIFLATRLLARVTNAFFNTARAEGMDDEVAHATQRLVAILLWVFGLVVAYPYLPGSGTAAFQGVSVFVGLMVSLGATGIVSQILGGLVVVYSRAFGRGDYVKIGEQEGTITEIGALAAKMLTRRKEEITIPHSVVVGSATTNFSRQAKVDGATVATTLTIGYDTPWRQVEALLIGATKQTPAVLQQPAPKVLKLSLSDFYVEYRLLFNIARAEERYVVLSDLHSNILDAFNEHGVQIMSPHFEGQPEGRVFVPKAKWHAAPAAPGDGGSGTPHRGA